MGRVHWRGSVTVEVAGFKAGDDVACRYLCSSPGASFWWRPFTTAFFVAVTFFPMMMSPVYGGLFAAVSFSPHLSPAFFCFHIQVFISVSLLLGVYRFFRCDFFCRSRRDFALCAKSLKEVCWYSAEQSRRSLPVGSVASYTNRSLKDFSSYTTPKLNVFVYKTCACSAVVINPSLRLRTSISSFRALSSMT